jgi:hypothetical protein
LRPAWRGGFLFGNATHCSALRLARFLVFLDDTNRNRPGRKEKQSCLAVGLEEGGSTVVSKIPKILCHVRQKFSKEMSKRPELDSREEIREGAKQ